MDRLGVISRSLIALILLCSTWCAAEKLSPDQKAPPFARGSGGLILNTPLEGEQRGQSPASNTADGVQREEKESYKEVDGETVRTVEGSFSYQSPEGLPVSVKYVADENGNRASFKFGSGQGGAASPGVGAKPGGQSGGGAGGQSPGSGTYLPPNGDKDKKVDRSYLPPQ